MKIHLEITKLEHKLIKLKEPIEVDWSVWNDRLGYPLSKKEKREFIKYLNDFSKDNQTNEG